MKKLVLSSLMTVLVSQAAGCIISSGTDGEDALITAQWSLKSLASNQSIPYPPGVTTAAVYSQEVDASYRPIGQPIIDLFDVEDNAGTTAGLPPSVYQVWVELTSEGGSNVHARSLSAYVDVIDTDKTFTTEILEDGGYFQLAWNLVGAGNAPLTCEQAGLSGGRPSGIYIEAFLANETMAEASDIFDCADGAGITAGYPAGDYDVLVDARVTTEQIAGSAPTIATSVDPRNAVTNLGTVTIPIQ
ncbi:MAG: hypothetical protein SFX73_11060 [Kofleriaceae bacterium]|nr:hypothetical protein [Kofleriaceae bacterium]